ncbi:MAG: ribosome biogenesis GTPase Der [Planctomycetota bacterium]|nr:ribosome biogenesis GTPase Der [Planctomycetota bacterium]
MTPPPIDNPMDDVSANEVSQPIPAASGGIPCVAIVGRPNVGKSTLFNALAGRRVAIEDPMAGVTRDRVSFLLDQESQTLELIDTGGIGHVDDQQLKSEVDDQIAMALDLADLILFVVDCKTGLTTLDKDIASRLRRLEQPVLLIANKVEGAGDEAGFAEAYTLGFGDPVRISAKERLGTTDLRDSLFSRLGDVAEAPMMPADVVRLAIVGRMNAGKSTLVNSLVRQERVIVSEVAGTTRDAVDVPFVRNGRRFIAIDTAGIRKRKTISDSVEFYGQSRAHRAIRRANVVLLLLDATRDVGRIDREIAGMIVDCAIPVVMVVTKWDLARETAQAADYETYLRGVLAGLSFAPITLISAPEDFNINATLALAAELHDQAGERVSTGELNRVLRRTYEIRKPRASKGRIGKIYYASQVETHPPTLVIFVNEPKLFEEGWRRFLIRRLQESLPYGEIPILLRFQQRGPS